jgi:hypothetical protein
MFELTLSILFYKAKSGEPISELKSTGPSPLLL